MSSPNRWRLLLALGLTWTVYVIVRYAMMIGELPAGRLRGLYGDLSEFFLWQAGAFLLLGVIAGVLRPALVGRLSAIYLGISTMVLLVLAREIWLPVAFLGFLLWCLCSVQSMRLALARVAGEEQATLGLAAATTYAVLIHISFLLGILKIMMLLPTVIVAAVTALPGGIHLLRSWRSYGRSAGRWLAGLNPVGAAALGAIWISAAVAFIWANAPESAPDSMRWHLPHIQTMVRNHGLEPQYIYYTYLYPNAVQACFAAAYVIGSVHLAKWLSWSAVLLLATLVYEEVALRSGKKNLGMLASAAIFTYPLLLNLSTTLYVDHVAAVLCIAAFLSLSRGLRADSRRGVMLSAFIMGCAAQTKYYVFLFCIVWGVALVVYAVRNFTVTRGLEWCIAPMRLFGAGCWPWYLYTYMAAGNPIYPYFNGIFHSPHWPEGRPFNIFSAYKDSHHIKYLAPWGMTFRSSQIDSAPNGGLGFQVLAMLPFLLALRRLSWRSGLGLGLAGLSFIACTAWYINAPRYWLAGHPLLLMMLFLAFGYCIEKACWEVPRPLVSIAAAGVLVALLVQVPFWNAGWRAFPWKVYTKEIPEERWQTRLFKGYPAIKELNKILRPGDVVVAAPDTAIYEIDANSHVFPFWHLSFNGIHDADSLDRFMVNNSIRYWVNDFSSSDVLYFESKTRAGSRYWTDSRLVAASDSVAVYDVSNNPGPRRFISIQSSSIPPLLHAGSKPEDSTARDNAHGWEDPFADDSARAAKAMNGIIEIPPRGAVEHTFVVPSGADLCRAKIDLGAEPWLTGVRLILVWSDENQKQLETTAGTYHISSRESAIHFFGMIPEGAKHGRLSVKRREPKRLELGRTTIDVWRLRR